MTIFRSLSNRSFSLLWIGQSISNLGNRFYDLALAWWVLQNTGSATAMGTVLIFGRLPMLLFLLVGGVSVDRFPRIRIMMSSDLTRGIMVTVMALLAFTDTLQVWHVYIISALFGLTSAFFGPAYTALIPEITPTESLPSANSLTSISKEITGTIGPSLAAFIITLGGTSLALGLNAASFFVSAMFLLPLLGLSINPVLRTPSSNLLSEAREGIHEVLSSPWLWGTITMFAIGNITVGASFIVVLPLFIQEQLQADVKSLGLLYSLLALGSVLAAIVIARLTRIRHRGVKAYSAQILYGLMALLLAWSSSIGWAVFIVVIVGAASATINLIWLNTLQTLVPQEKLGRVSSIDYFGSALLTPFGFALAGWAADQFSPSHVFIIGGAITAASAGLALLHPAISKLD